MGPSQSRRQQAGEASGFQTRGDIDYWVARHLKSDQLFHLFTSRKGGKSTGSYASLNLGFSSGDNPEIVRENRRIFEGLFQYSLTQWGIQVHGDEVLVLNEAAQLLTGREPSPLRPGEDHRPLPGSGENPRTCDAMATNLPGVPLTILFADCVPVYFWDPKKKVIALAHAGWRSTLREICKKTLQKIEEAFQVNPKDILVAIGPSIGPCCFEVGEDVARKFVTAFPPGGLTACGERLVRRGGRFFLDLWSLNKMQLVQRGVQEEGIVISGLCTSCHRDSFYSYRRDRKVTGRMAAMMVIHKR